MRNIDDFVSAMSALLAVIGMILVLCSLSWTITYGMVYILSMFFQIPFSIKTVTGVWFFICFLKMIFSSSNKGKK